MFDVPPRTTHGILKPKAVGQEFLMSRPGPSCDLSFMIDHYWIVHWDLRGLPPYCSETLPFPVIQIAIEKRRPEVYGVVSKKFSRQLRGTGRVFGIKFRPAMFFPFLNMPLSRLTDRIVSLRSVFGESGSVLRREILSEEGEPECVRTFESFVRKKPFPNDPMRDSVRDLVEEIAGDRALVRAEQAAKRLGVSLRTMQLAFHKYIGVTPKWVIRRFRLQEAAEQLAQGSVSLVDLSAELGYFDQPHFIRDFRSVIGCSPAKYAATTSLQFLVDKDSPSWRSACDVAIDAEGHDRIAYF